MSEIILSPSQEQACDEFRTFLRTPEQREYILAGFAGSGKSFLVTYLLQLVQDEYTMLKLIYKKAKPTRFHYSATTNKAATVLSDMTGGDAKTIHSILGLQLYNNFANGTVSLIQKNDPKNLDDSVLIIDEASMITRELLDIIRAASRKCKNSKILYVGDSYQLPPVKEQACPLFYPGPGVHFLTDIHRQVAGSPIITLSNKYREILDNPDNEWPDIIGDNKSVFMHTSGTSYRTAIEAAYLANHGPTDLRILGWTNKKVQSYNRFLRTLLGYTGDFAVGEVVTTNNPILAGDRMLGRTDSLHTIRHISEGEDLELPGYEITLEPHNAITSELLHVFQPKSWVAAKQLSKKYATEKDWHNHFHIKEQWTDLRAIYASTVHKSQGSTYKKVFIDVADIGKNNKWDEVARMMYVAITRASHEVHFLGKLEERYTRNDPSAIMEAFTNGTFKTL